MAIRICVFCGNVEECGLMSSGTCSSCVFKPQLSESCNGIMQKLNDKVPVTCEKCHTSRQKIKPKF